MNSVYEEIVDFSQKFHKFIQHLSKTCRLLYVAGSKKVLDSLCLIYLALSMQNKYCKIGLDVGHMAQLVERCIHIAKVSGSNPDVPTASHYGQVFNL